MSAAEHIETVPPPSGGAASSVPRLPDVSGTMRAVRADAPPGELRPGDLVEGRYVIDQLIGCGGHGAIHRARHLELELPVAIKVVQGGPEGAHPQILQRFSREAKIAARIRHRNVLSVLDTGRLPDGSPFMVMELIDGEDLERRIAKGALSIAAIVDLGRQLFSALAAIAEAGVLHRDVKPANVMLHRETDGQVLLKLVDFGIARSRAELERLTVTGAVMGTPHYMSPEQLKGEPLDARADMYAAAAVLYEALTGRPPFDGPATALVIGQILSASFVPIRQLRPECPASLAEIVEGGLSRKRKDRPSHPMQVVAALDALAAAEGLPTGALAWAGDPGLALTAPLGLERRRLHTRAPGDGEGEEIEELPPEGASLLPLVPDDPEPAQAPSPPDRIHDPTPSLPRKAGHAAWAGGMVALVACGILGALWASGPTEAAHAEVAPPIAAAAPPTASNVSPAATPARPSVDDLLASGLEALARDEVETALAQYRAAVAVDPGRPEAHRGRGVAASRAGFDDEAIVAYERYLALAPDAADRERVRARLSAIRERRSERLSRPRPHPRQR